MTRLEQIEKLEIERVEIDLWDDDFKIVFDTEPLKDDFLYSVRSITSEECFQIDELSRVDADSYNVYMECRLGSFIESGKLYVSICLLPKWRVVYNGYIYLNSEEIAVIQNKVVTHTNGDYKHLERLLRWLNGTDL